MKRLIFSILVLFAFSNLLFAEEVEQVVEEVNLEVTISPDSVQEAEIMENDFSRFYKYVTYRFAALEEDQDIDFITLKISDHTAKYINRLELYLEEDFQVLAFCKPDNEKKCTFEDLNLKIPAGDYIDLAVRAEFKSSFENASEGQFYLELLEVIFADEQALTFETALKSFNFSYPLEQLDFEKGYNNDSSFKLGLDFDFIPEKNLKMTDVKYTLAKYFFSVQRETILTSFSMEFDGKFSADYFESLGIYSTAGLLSECSISEESIVTCNDFEYTLTPDDLNYLYIRTELAPVAFDEGGVFEIQFKDLSTSGDSEYAYYYNEPVTIDIDAREYKFADLFDIEFLYLPKKIKADSSLVKLMKFEIDSKDGSNLRNFEWTHVFNGEFKYVDKVYLIDDNGKILDSSIVTLEKQSILSAKELLPGRSYFLAVDINKNAEKNAYFSLRLDRAVGEDDFRDDYFFDTDIGDARFSFGEDDENFISEKNLNEEVMENLNYIFSDFNQATNDSLRGQAANYLYLENLINGYVISEDPFVTEFRGENELNRAEALKFIINSLDFSESEMSNNKIFSDVDTDSWYSKYVSTGYDLGIINGYEDGSFKPSQKVNKMEFVKMLVEAHDLEKNVEFEYEDVDKTKWYAPYIGISQELDLFPEEGSRFDGKEILDRWSTSLAVYQLIK